MQFTHENPSARFFVADKLTVRQQLTYVSAAFAGNDSRMGNLWDAARAIIEGWQCDLLPDKDIDLDTVTDPQITNIVTWAGLEVKKHIDHLAEIPKN
jgi:hypothetical protein